MIYHVRLRYTGPEKECNIMKDRANSNKNILSAKAMTAVRRFIALLLVLALILPGVPVIEARADDEDNLDWKQFNVKTTVSSGSAVSNTYILEVSSGTHLKGGSFNNIQYINVIYKSATGEHTAVIMPGIDGLSSGYSAAYRVGRRSYGYPSPLDFMEYKQTNPLEHEALGSVETNQFMFTTPETINTIERIQIFGRRTEEDVEWTCQGMRLFKVDTLYGLDTYGYYSDDSFIDFEGTIIADVLMSGSTGGLFRWKSKGGTYNITPNGDHGLKDCILVTAENAGQYSGRSHYGLRHTAQAPVSQVVFRLDLADKGGAGFDALCAEYSNGKAKISGQRFRETAVLRVRYEDTYGCYRDVYLPYIMSTLGQIEQTLGDAYIAGIAQQGETIAFSATLPDFKSVISASIRIGDNGASAGLVSSASGADSVIRNRDDIAKNDDVYYTCFAVYPEAKCYMALDGAVVRYKFIPGANNPVKYSTTTSTSGIMLESLLDNSINLVNYKAGLVLEPRESAERYLVTIFTDTVENAGTADDIEIQFKYNDLQDKERVSPSYNIREYVNDFYGKWPASTDEFAYKYGLASGGKVQFIIPLQSVLEFLDVSVKISGNDEWQMAGLTIAMVKNSSSGGNPVGHRTVEWKELEVQGSGTGAASRLRSHLLYSRKVQTGKKIFSIGDLEMEDDGAYDPSDDDWTPGYLIDDSDEWTIINGDGEEVAKKDDVDWDELSKHMTYQDTQKSLGFTKERGVYQVDVKVAGDKTNVDDDDCGSANLFYFQLIFEHGVSGVTLANQQIPGDAFRTGSKATFYIPVSQNYGDLVSVRVIPDDQDSNSNIYDKLKIEYIDVIRDSNTALVATWTARGNTEDGLGWVGIEYREQGQLASNYGMEGRTVSELATDYQITESTYSAKLMVCITTGSYKKLIKYDANNNPYTMDEQSLVGGMSMDLYYQDSDGNSQPVENLDIIKLMNDYAGRTGTTTRVVQTDTGDYEEEMPFYVSNAAYQFRAGKQDKFYLSIKDVWKINSMTLNIRSSCVTNWNIQDVSIYLVQGNGSRYINENGEFDYRYPSGREPILVAQWASDDVVTVHTDVYKRSQEGNLVTEGSVAQVKFAIDCEPIELSSTDKNFRSIVPKEPKSSNDTLNLFIYMDKTKTASDPKIYDMQACVKYIDATNMMLRSASANVVPNTVGADEGIKVMNRTTDEDGNTIFYATGISADNMSSLEGVDVNAFTRVMDYEAPIKYAILQRVRSGVLIDSYLVGGTVDARTPQTLHSGSLIDTRAVQRVFLQVSKNAEEQAVETETRDLALAVNFVPDEPEAKELRSKYIYLSDLGISKLSAGQIVEFDFDLGDVKEITGISIAALGTMRTDFANIYIAEQGVDGSILRDYSFEGGVRPTQNPMKVEPSGKLLPVRVELKTATDEMNFTSGTEDAVKMIIGYNDIYGEPQTREIPNARTYIQTGEGFKSGGTDVVEIMIPAIKDLRWIQLEPVHGDDPEGTRLASWKVETVSAAIGITGRPVVRTVNKRIIEGNPVKVFVSDILVVGSVKVFPKPVKDDSGAVIPVTKPAEDFNITTGDEKSVTVSSGARVEITVKSSGSTSGFDAKLVMLDEDGNEVEAELDSDTNDEENSKYIEELYEQAKASYESDKSTKDEKKAAKKVMELIESLDDVSGSFRYGGQKTEEGEEGKENTETSETDEDKIDDDMIIFVPPVNYSDEKVTYRIYVSSRENDEMGYMLEVIVKSENDELADAIEEWMKDRTVAVYTDPNGAEELMANGTEHAVNITSGSEISVNSLIGDIEGLDVDVVQIDPETNRTVEPNYDALYDYDKDKLENLLELAEKSAASETASASEKSAATKLVDILTDMLEGDGEVSFTDETITFKAPRNYSGEAIKYRITVQTHVEETDEDDEETSGGIDVKAGFVLEITVKSESDKLKSALEKWNSLRSAGAVTVKEANGSDADVTNVLNDGNANIAVDSGEGVKVDILAKDDIYVKVVMVDSDTDTDKKVSYVATHGFNESYLNTLIARAEESMASELSSDTEKTLAAKVKEQAQSMLTAAGSYTEDGSTVTFFAPRNYSGAKAVYRIYVTAGDEEDDDALSFTVTITVRSEKNDLEDNVEKWNSARTVGRASIIDADGNVYETSQIKMGDETTKLIESRETIKIEVNPLTGEKFDMLIYSYDPASGAIGKAAFNTSHGVSDEELAELKNDANSVLAMENATEAEIKAANEALAVVGAMKNSAGSFLPNSKEGSFVAPGNYTGSNMYYQLKIVDAEGSSVAKTVISVRPEANTFNDVKEALAKAVSDGTEARNNGVSNEENNGEPESGGDN